MKDQYFGDNRDLFKFDLARLLAKSFECPVDYIPMLTSNDMRTDGKMRNRSQAKAGTKNKELIKFLDDYSKRKMACVTNIQKYFESIKVKAQVLGHRGHHKENDFFDQICRNSHFLETKSGLRKKPSLVLFDPDNGMEVRRSNHRHLLYEEIRRLYEETPAEAIFMIYQHFPREKRRQYLANRMAQLRVKAGVSISNWVHDNQIAFFLFSRHLRLNSELKRIVRNYGRFYPKLEASVN